MTSHSSRLAIVFDFDDTLAPDSTSSYLESQGIDVRDFWKRNAARLGEGWDPIPSYMDMMLRESAAREPRRRFTRDSLVRFGRKLKPHKGLQTFFARIEKVARDSSPDAELYFFIISSGLRDLISEFRCRDNFRQIWASNFAYNPAGEICGVKNVVSFTDKTRYLFEIQKGLFMTRGRPDPFAVNRKVKESDYFVNFNRMIMVGDGYTDVPCFSLIEKSGGTAIGVYDRNAEEKWGKAWGLMSENRVKQMVAADFSKNSGLDDALSLAVRNMLKLHRFT